MKIVLSSIATMLVLTACGSQSVSNSTLTGAKGNFSDDWCHARFQTNQGASLSLDYQLRRVLTTGGMADQVQLSPAWLNVTRYTMTGREAVRAVLLDYTYSVPHGAINYPWRQVTLPAVDLIDVPGQSRFTKELNGLVASEVAGGFSTSEDKHFFEVAVVIDGEWQKTRTDGQSNFRIDPNDGGNGYCLHQ